MNRTIKHLSVLKNCIDDIVIEQISTFGANLLSLELTYKYITKFSNAKFPRLRKLVMIRNSGRENQQLLDFCENPDSLEELRLEYEVISLSLINSLKCLSNLKTLSLYHCTIKSSEYQSCLEKLGSLKSLRTLDLIWMEFEKPGVCDALLKLTNLENLDVTMSHFNEKDHKMILNFPKKWKKLGLYQFRLSYVESEHLVFTLADQVFGVSGPLPSILKNILSSMEYYINNWRVTCRILKFLLCNHHLLPVEETPRIEKIILDNFDSEYGSDMR